MGTEKVNTRMLFAVLLVCGIGIAGNGLWVNNKIEADRKDRAEFAEATENDFKHVFTVVLRNLERGKLHPAIHVDKNGTLLWCNERATTLLNIHVGDHVNDLMRPDKRDLHNHHFAETVADPRAREATNLVCEVKTISGWKWARVQTWVVPDGAMAFIDLDIPSPVDETDDAGQP